MNCIQILIIYIIIIHLGQNRISFLPESFGNLKSLKFFFISKNFLECLPSSIGNCTSLTDLSLDNNKVRLFRFIYFYISYLFYHYHRIFINKYTLSVCVVQYTKVSDT